MGSDMAMERITILTFGRWEMVEDTQVLAIYRRSSYDNKEIMLWRGEVNTHNQALIEAFISRIPERPEPVQTPRTRVMNVLEGWGPSDGRGEPWDNEDLGLCADEILNALGGDQ